MLIAKLPLCVAKILQDSPYPEQNTIISPNKVKVGRGDVSCHKRELNDAMFNHTPNRSNLKRVVFVYAFKVRAPLLILQKD